MRRTAGRGNENREMFQAALRQFADLWNETKDSRQWVGLQMLRDQIIAHTDLIFVDDAASTIDIAGSGLTIDDLPNVHARTQDLVERVHSIVTGKIPDYGPTHKRGQKAAETFWKDTIHF